MKRLIVSGAIVICLAASAARGEVRRIDLPRYQSDLPDGPGRVEFASACLSCHSTTYITMQPPMTAAKWEESVRKMVKVYAAPIEEAQVAPIVAYVMAVKENKQGTFAEVATTPPRGANRVVAPLDDPAKRAADAERGAALFAQNCASCHGPRGAGDGPSAASQLPRPTDLTNVLYADEAMCAAVIGGVPGTAMPGFPDLSDDDLRAIVTFSQSLTKTKVTHVQPKGNELALYAQHCASCHGARGAGDGPLAPTAPRPPANFRLLQPDHDRALRMIADGIPATTMPPWKQKLSEGDRKLLAEYVQSFYAGSSSSSKK